MGVTDSDRDQDVEIARITERVNAVENQVSDLVKTSSEMVRTSAVQASNIDKLTQAMEKQLEINSSISESVTTTRADVKWIRIIGGTIVGAIGTVLVLILTGALKV